MTFKNEKKISSKLRNSLIINTLAQYRGLYALIYLLCTT